MSANILIVGAGHGAGQLVTSLKQHGHDGRIAVFGDEVWLPYQRPPLSKKFLAGELPAERLYVKPATFYEGIAELHLGTAVAAIDPAQQTLTTASGAAYEWDRLVLATGSRVRRLPDDGKSLAGVHYLRNIDDVDAIRADVDEARRAVIIGAGYIGLEVAAVLRSGGLDVTVVELAERVMSRVVSPELSDFYQFEHTSQGVRLRLGTGVAGLHGRKRVKAVELADGEQLEADVVVVGVGIVPNTELAAAAGLAVDDGIVVDDHCRTSHESIYAIGDCTSHPSAIYGRRIRLESVQNALEQAKTAAANLCGDDAVYDEVPWFWSDQYDLKLQIAGLSTGYDQVVMRGNPADRSFACMYLRDDVLIATDAVNSPRDFMQSKALIAAHIEVDADRLADPAVALKDLAG